MWIWWWIWVAIIVLILLLPLSYGWTRRDWGPPYPATTAAAMTVARPACQRRLKPEQVSTPEN
jgi:hypothetical protein